MAHYSGIRLRRPACPSGRRRDHTKLYQKRYPVSGFAHGRHLSGGHLRGAKVVEQSQLDQACAVGAELPAALTLKPCPPPK
jgi:hypothetical protein